MEASNIPKHPHYNCQRGMLCPKGQRAGRELWFEKPFEVQEQDVADFSQGIASVKKLIEDALALLREKDAEIERLRQNEKKT